MPLIAAWLFACATPAPAPAPVAPPAPTTEQRAEQAMHPKGELPWKRPPFEARMHEQFAFATDAVYHVIRGDLAQVNAQGRSLLELAPPEAMPPGWQPQYDDMKAVAKRVAEAPDLTTASVAVVDLGAACATCHTTHPGPTASVGEVLGDGWSTPGAMQRHQWAAYVMWVGLFLPSEDVFRAGAQQLSHEGAIPSAGAGHGALEVEVHTLAARAAAAGDEAGRNAAYAGMLARCAGCHQAAGVAIE